ncbi:DUF6452 family protein [Lutibacter citreus]|uniref:DUF6452 family protein n=1 Tax=Lutibacter citreus TaxID=2138210 RepID=UPI000DBE3787|nr:DUF6452 family protein [Lutibacter citreus]
MKKYILVIILSFTLVISCDKDDICLEDTTPNLVLKFVSFENDTIIKEITIDSIRALNSYDIESFQASSLDSISIPLDFNENTTTYKISSNGTSDTIVFNYHRNDVFVSRSCGYITIFEDLEIESTTNHWIKGFNINNTTIDNDTISHINILH